ncbi:metallophosphoesterase [Natronomonas sp. EA1]|uniref:metallophosphoesterase n=1 Tax=Natronomonas sp. EA1 TaxID=3421655 RepID=UPI003EBB8BF7
MLVVVSDTHGRDSHRLEGRTLEAVESADLVLHAGDFTTEAVLDAFEAICELRGVTGNNDTQGLRDRLPKTRVVEWNGCRIAMAHGHEHTDTSLALFGRQSNADLVVVGHSHDPGFGHLGTVPVLNPGSHADPRWHRPAHAELEVEDGSLVGKLVEPDGTVFEEFRVEKRG